jgi:phosphomannomutase
VQVLPDPDEPLIHLYAEGSSDEVSRELERELEQSVAQLIGQQEIAVPS